MMRVACSATLLVPVFTLVTSVALAQTPATPAADEGPLSVQVTAAATLGHKSASAFGAEVGYRLSDTLELFVEAGHMGNVTTADIEGRANKIALALRGTANVVQSANFGDVGVRYRLMNSGMWRSYVAMGLGLANIDTETTFATLATDVSVALGADLSGHVVKPLLVIGGGVTRPVGSRYFVDGSYRYGRIFPKSSAVDADKGGNTQRVQVGFGMRF